MKKYDKMKIVKEFEDDTIIVMPLTGSPQAIITWGLSQNGQLCYKRNFIKNNNQLFLINEYDWMIYDYASFGIPILVMKRIISEFGNLLPFV